MATRVKTYWGVSGPMGTWGRFSRKRDAQQAAKQQREADRQAGNKGAIRVVRVNPHRVTRSKRATSRRKKNPVRVAASMAGKSTGWMPAKAVRVVKGKGGQVRVDVKR